MVPETPPQAYPQALWMIRHMTVTLPRHFLHAYKTRVAANRQRTLAASQIDRRWTVTRESRRIKQFGSRLVGYAMPLHKPLWTRSAVG